MSTPKLKFAQLDPSSLARLHQMEEEFGALIIAVQPEYPIAKLTDAQLNILQSLEQKLGVILIAYEK